MISIDDYRATVLGLGSPVDHGPTPLLMAGGHVTARAVMAASPVPAFDNSAMDGFAVRASDIASAPVTLPVATDIPAGRTDIPVLEPGTAARIMTGAPIPDGADTIVQVEKTEDADKHMGAEALPQVRILEAVPAATSVRLAGEDIAAGETALEPGTMLGPTQIAALASIGVWYVDVYRKPVVGILSTGSELRRPGEELKPGQIYESNSYLLRELVRGAGAEPVLLEASTDEAGEFGRIFDEAAQYVDAIVTTGGVSAGAFDVVKEHLSSRGITFTQVAMQPGKPQGCGTYTGGDRAIPVLCLPGNPVSVFVSFKVFGDALIRKLTGRRDEAVAWQEWPAGKSWTCPPDRAQFMPCVRQGDTVVPATSGGSGSHLVYSLAKARGLIFVSTEVESVSRGDTVKVWWLS